MEVGVGLPSVVPGAGLDLVREWARLADTGSFSSLCAHDRLAWESIDCLAALRLAAGETNRVRLASLVLIAPLRETDAIVAEVDAIGPRLALGVGIGPRADDYAAAGADFHSRGRRLEGQLAELRERWPGTVLVGGGGDAALDRMARLSDGYVHGGGPARAFKAAADRALAAWYDNGRRGAPRLVGTAYFALGGADEQGRDFLRSYYRFVGPFSERIAQGVLASREEIEELAGGYAEAGCDEMVLFPTVPRLEQLELLGVALSGIQSG